MNFSESLVHAHSTEETEPNLVVDILTLLDIWDKTESAPNGSALQQQYTASARVFVDKLRTVWKLSTEEIIELDDYKDEFRQMFAQPHKPVHQQAS